MNDIEKEIVLLKNQEEETRKECERERDRYAESVISEIGPSMKEFLSKEEEEEKKPKKESKFFNKLKKVLG